MQHENQTLRLQRNREFHADLFLRRPTARHAVIARSAGHPLYEQGDYTTSTRPITDFVPSILEDYQHWVALSEAVADDAVPFASLMTGTHIYAVCMGAQPHYYPDSNPYALPCVTCADDADRLAEPVLENSRPLMRVLELADALRRELGPEVTLGCPDMQTGFDTACIVWDKTDLFCAIIEQPDAVKRLAGKCSRLLTAFIAAYRREFPNTTFGHCPGTWTPPECGPWVSNDECGILSPAMFEEFCLPELIDLAQRFGGIGMHCCANARHQFALFRRIPNFYAFNRVPTHVGWEQDNALDELGGPDGPVHVPGWCGPDDVALLLRKAPTGTRFIFNSEPFSELDKARAWMDRVRAAIR